MLDIDEYYISREDKQGEEVAVVTHSNSMRPTPCHLVTDEHGKITHRISGVPVITISNYRVPTAVLAQPQPAPYRGAGDRGTAGAGDMPALFAFLFDEPRQFTGIKSRRGQFTDHAETVPPEMATAIGTGSRLGPRIFFPRHC